MQYKAIHYIPKGLKVYKPGETICNLTKEEAERLMAKGAIMPVHDAPFCMPEETDAGKQDDNAPDADCNADENADAASEAEEEDADTESEAEEMEEMPEIDVMDGIVSEEVPDEKPKRGGRKSK